MNVRAEENNPKIEYDNNWLRSRIENNTRPFTSTAEWVEFVDEYNGRLDSFAEELLDELITVHGESVVKSVVLVPGALVCVECGRRFDLSNETDSAEWHYGHDCEA